MPQLKIKSNDEELDKIVGEVEQAGLERDQWGNIGGDLWRFLSESLGIWAEGRREDDDRRNDQKSIAQVE